MRAPRRSRRTRTSSSRATPRRRARRIPMAPISYVGPVDLQRDRQVQEGRIQRPRQARGRPVAEASVHEERGQRLGRAWSSTTSSRHGCRATRRSRRASSTRASSTAASTRRASSCRSGTIAPGATAEVKVPLYVGPQEQDELAKLAKGLDLVVDYGIFTVHRGAALLAAQVAVRHRPQLGLGDRAR